MQLFIALLGTQSFKTGQRFNRLLCFHQLLLFKAAFYETFLFFFLHFFFGNKQAENITNTNHIFFVTVFLTLFCLVYNLELCLFTGFFTQISTLADVQENVMEYLHVLSRPKVIDQEHDVVWTEAYIDSTVSLHDKAFNIGLLHIVRN